MRTALLALLLLFPATFAIAAPDFSLKDGTVTVRAEGKAVTISEEDFMVTPVENSDLRYGGAGEDAAAELGIPMGLYLFDASGRGVGYVETEEIEFSYTAQLSPGGTVLALDSGTWLVRSWSFFSYPDLKPLGEPISYYDSENRPSLLWNGDNVVYFSSMSMDESERTCEYDPCGEVSVSRYDLAAGELSTVMEGTPLCDYTLAGLADGQLSIEKLCLPALEDWKTAPEGKPFDTVRVKAE
ncbi:hypothetical protein LJC23_00575 [Desulfovibrio sp. OttesenSCG-928-I05]|nr:hypothetical protein [Desulfovibrio sp. OttesenSCG-928-I05]